MWWLASALAVWCAVQPSWPLAVLAAVLAASGTYRDHLAHEVRRREIIGEELLTRLSEVEQNQAEARRSVDSITTRLVTVENRTRPIGGK